MLVNYLVTRLQQAMGNPTLQGEVQQQLYAYGILPTPRKQRAPEKSLVMGSISGTGFSSIHHVGLSSCRSKEQAEHQCSILVVQPHAANKQKATWEHYLPLVEYAYNNTVHTSSGKAPFEIVEGKIVLSILQTKDKIFEVDKYVQNTDEAYTKIKIALKKTQSKQKKAADCHRREIVFSLGDWVLLRFEKARLRKLKGKEHLSPKLEYMVPEEEQPEVEEFDEILVHVNLLRPFVGDVSENMVLEELPEVEQLDEILVPQQILAHKERKVRGKVARRYLVKFKNYSPMDAEWMEESELLSKIAWGVSLSSHCCSYSQQVAVIECRAGRSSSKVSTVNFYDYSHSNKNSNFFERLVQAWQVLFPPKPKAVSNAEIAKQRLKMILISDRCAISDDAKRIIVDNVVGALSNFVEIESEEKVQLNVSADPDLGTVYSVIVPVRRVKPEYQAYSHNLRNMKYGDTVGQMRTLDVRFEYPDDLE
ncbi:hypothetical protein L7F22_036636 [Adiantum nelumboides]|nr:hypothetical protein [Adiantum nelumboides]